MNLESMETAVKRFGFDSTDPLLTWINAAMHDLEDAFDWPWLESKLEEVEMPMGSNTITLPANCLKILTIRDLTNLRKLEYWNRHKFAREIREPTEVGWAEIYTLISTNQIQIWRVLSGPTKFEVWFQATTPDLVNPADEPKTSTNLWPTSSHYPIVLKAAALALQAENEEERAKVALEQYEKMLENLKRKYGERELDEPETVTDVMGYMGEERRGSWW